MRSSQNCVHAVRFQEKPCENGGVVMRSRQNRAHLRFQEKPSELDMGAVRSRQKRAHAARAQS